MRVYSDGGDVRVKVRDRARNTAYQFLRLFSGPGRGIRLILLYHSIGGETPLSIPVDVFEQEMNILARRFQIVPVRALGEVAPSASADLNLASVTFDDGYRDNYERALPVLERLGLKGTFFITTDFLGHRFPSSVGSHPMMAPHEVRELAALGHEIGAHTQSHPKLTRVPLDAAREEIEGSKRALEDLVNREVVSFAYPKGDYNEGVKMLVASYGFRVAVTVREGLVNGNPDWLALPRLWISDQLTPATFEAKLTPATDWWARLRLRS